MVQQQHRTVENPPERAGLAGEHSKVCWFLSNFFLHCPDRQFLLTLQHQLASQHEHITPVPASGLARLWEVLADGVDDALVQRLAVEHTRLFGGLSHDGGPPPPHESLYRGDTLMGKAYLAVIRSYQQAGYGIVEPDAGPQDHIAAELRFISMLFHNEVTARQQSDLNTAVAIQQQQEKFLNEHLLQWIPEYCQCIKTETTEVFYAAVAMMTSEALEKMR